MTSYSLNQEFEELVKATLAEKQLISDNNSNSNENENKEDMTDRSAKSPSFFQQNRLSVKKSKRKYTTTHIKSRNFLSNICNVGINKEDFYHENFIFDVYLLMTINLNPFLLNRKLNDPNKHEMIYMIWKECMPAVFYKHICQEENFIYLNGKNVLQPKVSETIMSFLKKDEKNYLLLRNNLSQFNTFFHMPTPMCTLKYTALRKEKVSTSKVHFKLSLKHKRIKKLYIFEKTLKITKIAMPIHACLNKNPYKLTILMTLKKEVKEHIEKRKIKRMEVAE